MNFSDDIGEDSYDVSNHERLSHINSKKSSTTLRKFEEQTGALIRVNESNGRTTIRIVGKSFQRGEAKILMRDLLERTSFIPNVSYFVLTESSLNCNKLKFVKYTENTENTATNNANGKSRYFVEFLKDEDEFDQIDDITDRLGDFLQLTPRQFNTFDKLDDCLDRLSLKLENYSDQSNKDSLFSERLILKPRVFFGKVLFSSIDNPDDTFTLHDWYKFNVLSIRGRRGSTGPMVDNEGKNVNVEFQQDSPQIYDEFKKIQRKFGFKWDEKKIGQSNKGSVYVYYTPSTNKKRKLKLHWNEEENKWKIVNHAYSLNRLANVDVISGSRAPDFRLSLKTNYELPSESSEVERVINDIQSSSNFSERDGMWFRSRDFDNTIIKRAVVRQIIEKKRFRNKDFLITFSTIKHDGENEISVQKIITFKHHTWAKKLELNDSLAFMNNVVDTFQYVQEMMSFLT